MKEFEYEITQQSSAEFQSLAFVCSNSGVCRQEQVPGGELEILTEIMNSRGKQGWELIQVSFREQRVVAFWKRERSA